MARYIEDENLIEEINSLRILMGGKDIFSDEAKKSVLRIIGEQPTADVIEVVRCKDCKYNMHGICINESGCNFTTYDGFCSFGERRDIK